ncbi:MAG: hypothetical protein WCG27_04220 [Pseudomonadota bacterium]
MSFLEKESDNIELFLPEKKSSTAQEDQLSIKQAAQKKESTNFIVTATETATSTLTSTATPEPAKILRKRSR